MLTETEFVTRATPIFAAELEQPGVQISLATKRDDLATWDSLAHVRIIVALEGDFGVMFDANEIEKFDTVGEIYHAVNNHLAS